MSTTIQRTIRIASIPASQVYIRHTAPPPDSDDAGTIVRLPDPDPDDPRATTESKWWPPVMLDAGWVRRNADAFDLMHIHFGFDAISATELRSLVGELRRQGKPLVYTLHDLRNPHQPDATQHDVLLDILVPAADHLITLTREAAGEITRRWGRTATVLPHPHVVALGELQRRQEARRISFTSDGVSRPFRLGVHLKSLRPNIAAEAVITALLEVLPDLPGAVLQVNSHPEILTPGNPKYRADLHRLLDAGGARGLVDLRVHPYFNESQLWDYLASLDVSVLPYRFGTHSGWLEACADLGTPVIAPSCGYYAHQQPSVVEFQHDETGLDAQSLANAVKQVYTSRPRPALSVRERRDERVEIAAAHQRLYRRLVSGG